MKWWYEHQQHCGKEFTFLIVVRSEVLASYQWVCIMGKGTSTIYIEFLLNLCILWEKGFYIYFLLYQFIKYVSWEKGLVLFYIDFLPYQYIKGRTLGIKGVMNIHHSLQYFSQVKITDPNCVNIDLFDENNKLHPLYFNHMCLWLSSLMLDATGLKKILF